jgi:hypothetical protein
LALRLLNPGVIRAIFISLALQAAALLSFCPSSQAITMDQLRTMPHLTPEKFARYFADFEFKFHAEVQDHNVFLSTKSGDCDDYATVAADVLERHGYTPRMIAVRMKGETHVVCYIQETHSYLDYNTRREKNPLVPCSSEITAIAHNVALSFGRDWVATYEFTYEERDSIKRLVNTIIPNKRETLQAEALTVDQAKSGAKAGDGKTGKD